MLTDHLPCLRQSFMTVGVGRRLFRPTEHPRYHLLLVNQVTGTVHLPRNIATAINVGLCRYHNTCRNVPASYETAMMQRSLQKTRDIVKVWGENRIPPLVPCHLQLNREAISQTRSSLYNLGTIIKDLHSRPYQRAYNIRPYDIRRTNQRSISNVHLRRSPIHPTLSIRPRQRTLYKLPNRHRQPTSSPPISKISTPPLKLPIFPHLPYPPTLKKMLFSPQYPAH